MHKFTSLFRRIRHWGSPDSRRGKPKRRRATSQRPMTRPSKSDFLRMIEVYRSEVLGPAGLALEGQTLLHGFSIPHRCVYADAAHIVKFYHAKCGFLASNTVAATELLRGAGISTPRILFADVESESVRRHGLACVVMERIRGTPPAEGVMTREGAGLAPQLARMHSLRGDRWGPLQSAPAESFPEAWIVREIQPLVRQIQENSQRMAQPPFDYALDWLRRQSADLVNEATGFNFVWSDPNRTNLILPESGQPHLIDFDGSGYRAFGLDLAQVIINMSAPPGEIDLPANADRLLDMWESWAGPFLEDYFLAAPKSYRDRWRRMRRVCFVFFFLRYYAHRLVADPDWSHAEGLDPHGAVADTLNTRYILDMLIRS